MTGDLPRLGFGVPVSGGWATPAVMRRVARRAEELGYASLWTFQRVLSPVDGELGPSHRSVHDSIVALAYLAGQTDRIRLGTATLCAPFVAPAVLAKSLTSLDVLSGGRLTVGLGSGWLPQEYAAAGVPLERRGARMEEHLHCLHALWTQDPVEFAGEFYSVPRSHVAPSPVQRPHPPVLLGGAAEPALRRAGRLADGWIAGSHQDLTRIDACVRTVRDGAVAAGRDPQAVQIVVRGVVDLVDTDPGRRRRPLHGTREQVFDDLRSLAAQGVTEVFIDLNLSPRVVSPTVGPDEALAHAERVLDAFAPSHPQPVAGGGADLRAMLTGFRLSAALAAAADLGLPDELASGPRTVTDLAAAVSADRDTLHRLLRALASVGVFDERDDGRFALTGLGEGLRSDVRGSLRPLARTLTDPALWSAWGHVGHSVRTGENAFESLHGVDVWAHRRLHPQHNAIFNDTMAAQSALLADSVAAAYDFSTISSVVDVGGGRGVLLEAVLARHGHLSGTVFDRPHVVAQTPSSEATPSVAARWAAVSGDFFDTVPAADCYLLKWILHDWPDDWCVQILDTCRRGLRAGGVVLVVEGLLGRPGHEVDVAFSDLNMLVLPGGRERSDEEYSALFAAAGLRLNRVLHTDGRMSILEAVAGPVGR